MSNSLDPQTGGNGQFGAGMAPLRIDCVSLHVGLDRLKAYTQIERERALGLSKICDGRRLSHTQRRPNDRLKVYSGDPEVLL